MKNFGVPLAIFLFVLSGNSVSRADILPPNNLARFDHQPGLAGISEQQFNEILDHLIQVWQPMAQANGFTLVGEKHWQSSEVNAHAIQSGVTWTLQAEGGLARRAEITADGFALVLCHELGHFFGGYYFYPQSDRSSEGEADYFATQVCAKQIFKNTPAFIERFRAGASPIVRQSCDQIWKTPSEQELCYRTAAASLSIANLINALERNPIPARFETPDSSHVSETNVDHSHAQCRLDTLFQGILCPNPGNPRIIAGKGLPEGNNSPRAEQIAAQFSCMSSSGYQIGIRPACWFIGSQPHP